MYLMWGDVPSFTDAQAGINTALSYMAQGVDIMFAAASTTGSAGMNELSPIKSVLTLIL